MEQRLRRAVFDRLGLLGEEASNAEPGSLVTLARTEIRRLTGGWRELLARHQPDDDGRCPQCSGWVRRRRWPCPVWLAAHHQLIGEGVWLKQQTNQLSSPSGRRNPTVVIPRQLPAGPSSAGAHAMSTEPAYPPAEATPIHRAAIDGAQRPLPRTIVRSAS